MSNHNYQCFECGKELKKGEKAIVVNSILAYHSECYKQDRKRVWHSFAINREFNLKDITEKVELFSTLSNPDVLKGSREFAKLWSNQYAVISFMDLVLNDAERYGVISWLEKTSLKRKIDNNKNRTDEVVSLYNDWFALTLEQKTMQGYFVDISLDSNSPNEVLKEETHRHLINLAGNIQEICVSNREIIETLSKLSQKIAVAEMKEMQKQIDRIPKDIQTL